MTPLTTFNVLISRAMGIPLFICHFVVAALAADLIFNGSAPFELKLIYTGGAVVLYVVLVGVICTLIAIRERLDFLCDVALKKHLEEEYETVLKNLDRPKSERI